MDALDISIGLLDSELTADLTQLATSAQALVPLAKELLRYHAIHPPTGSGVSLPAVVGAGPRSRAMRPAASEEELGGQVLIADDNEGNRKLIARRLEREGYSSIMAADGREAINLLRRHKCDLALLDIMMPELDGVTVLHELKQDPDLRDIPVIMISAVEEISSVTECIEKGADDYLTKPIDPAVLKARVRSLVERSRLRAREKQKAAQLSQAMADVERERQISDKLLLNILPPAIADELRTNNSVQPMYYEDVTIVFTDFAGFTLSTENISAEELVTTLHSYFTAFDRITGRYGLEKLKTIGDSYLFVGGLPNRNSSHPIDAILAAWEMVSVGQKLHDLPIQWPVRIGIHTGPVIAGVVGIHKFAFDIWGDSVNFASRMESCGVPNRINISDRTYSRVKDFFACQHRGRLKTKDQREVDMYLVESLSPRLASDDGLAFSRRYSSYFRRDPPALPDGLFALRESITPPLT